ncbi:F-box protein [Quillaja saponaria]|uniref:F-box protein n=1 Tax=Quillaja saponaria TaxID=32244 RepID=A0AAD7KQT0_QUISA|nr:F-box protein [Quillaja saponaria]
MVTLKLTLMKIVVLITQTVLLLQSWALKMFPGYQLKAKASQAPPDCFKPEIKENMQIGAIIMEHSLPFLPAKSLCRFKTVSRGWNQYISTPFFSHRQANCFRDISGFFCQVPGYNPFLISIDSLAFGIPSPSLSFLPESVTIRSACNGLLCCQGQDGNDAYYICNPVSEQYEVLPKPNLYHGPESVVALVFEPAIYNFAANFELVCAIPMIGQPVVCFEIYSSRSRMWRMVDTLCCELEGLKLCADGFYMKGICYWETVSGAVLAFDLKNEEYGIFLLPSNSGPQGVLTVMHGELCYILPHQQESQWMIDIYGDVTMTLKQRIYCHLGNFLYDTMELLQALPFGSDDLLMLYNGTRLIAYHVKEQKATSISELSSDKFVRFVPYVNSLVQVDRHPWLSGMLRQMSIEESNCRL